MNNNNSTRKKTRKEGEEDKNSRERKRKQLGHSLLIPCSLSDVCMLLFIVNFSTCKLIFDWKFYNKQQYSFFHCKRFFFLKTGFISASMIVVNLLFFWQLPPLFCLLVFLTNLFMTYSKKKKVMNDLYLHLYLYFCFICFKCYSFCL